MLLLLQERVPKGFPGWEAKVVGADRVREDCLHVFVRFDVRLYPCTLPPLAGQQELLCGLVA